MNKEKIIKPVNQNYFDSLFRSVFSGSRNVSGHPRACVLRNIVEYNQTP